MYQNNDEEARRAYYKKRIAEMKREKELALKKRRQFQKLMRTVVLPVSGALVAIVIAVLVGRAVKMNAKDVPEKDIQIETEAAAQEPETATLVMSNPVPALVDSIRENQEKSRVKTYIGPQKEYAFQKNESTGYISSADMQSTYAILVDTESGEVVAQKDGYTRINPASMTKILTVLVAAENITEDMLDDLVTVTIDDTDYSYSNDCSAVGFAADETVTVRDLLYGTILPSGGDAASALSKYIAGSREEFVKMMNDKLEKLGLSETSHFTNCVGLYDTNHYSTVYDMAVIMNAAVDNELCKEIMNAHKYTTSETTQHPEGITVSNWFLRRIEDKDAHGEVMCAKTGYVVQSGNCAASYQVDNKGETYICVTADAHSSWRCIYDHVDIYQKYTG